MKQSRILAVFVLWALTANFSYGALNLRLVNASPCDVYSHSEGCGGGGQNCWVKVNFIWQNIHIAAGGYYDLDAATTGAYAGNPFFVQFMDCSGGAYYYESYSVTLSANQAPYVVTFTGAGMSGGCSPVYKGKVCVQNTQAVPQFYQLMLDGAYSSAPCGSGQSSWMMVNPGQTKCIEWSLPAGQTPSNAGSRWSLAALGGVISHFSSGGQCWIEGEWSTPAGGSPHYSTNVSSATYNNPVKQNPDGSWSGDGTGGTTNGLVFSAGDATNQTSLFFDGFRGLYDALSKMTTALDADLRTLVSLEQNENTTVNVQVTNNVTVVNTNSPGGNGSNYFALTVTNVYGGSTNAQVLDPSLTNWLAKLDRDLTNAVAGQGTNQSTDLGPVTNWLAKINNDLTNANDYTNVGFSGKMAFGTNWSLASGEAQVQLAGEINRLEGMKSTWSGQHVDGVAQGGTAGGGSKLFAEIHTFDGGPSFIFAPEGVGGFGHTPGVTTWSDRFSGLWAICYRISSYLLMVMYVYKIIDDYYEFLRMVGNWRGIKIQDLQVMVAGTGGNFFGMWMASILLLAFVVGYAALLALFWTSVTGAVAWQDLCHLVTGDLLAGMDSGSVHWVLSTFPVPTAVSLVGAYVTFRLTLGQVLTWGMLAVKFITGI